MGFRKCFKENLKQPLHPSLIPTRSFPTISMDFGWASIETLILSALHDWTKALEQNINVDDIYFEFMKAFGKVPLLKLVVNFLKDYVHPE